MILCWVPRILIVITLMVKSFKGMFMLEMLVKSLDKSHFYQVAWKINSLLISTQCSGPFLYKEQDFVYVKGKLGLMGLWLIVCIQVHSKKLHTSMSNG